VAKIIFIVCPLCYLGRPLEKNLARATKEGIPPEKIYTLKGRISFGQGDPETAPFVDIRDSGKGRGYGWPRVEEECKTLAEIKDDPDYADLVSKIRLQCKKILEIIGEEE